jgi:hypothetical protein
MREVARERQKTSTKEDHAIPLRKRVDGETANNDIQNTRRKRGTQRTTADDISLGDAAVPTVWGRPTQRARPEKINKTNCPDMARRDESIRVKNVRAASHGGIDGLRVAIWGYGPRRVSRRASAKRGALHAGWAGEKSEAASLESPRAWKLRRDDSERFSPGVFRLPNNSDSPTCARQSPGSPWLRWQACMNTELVLVLVSAGCQSDSLSELLHHRLQSASWRNFV